MDGKRIARLDDAIFTEEASQKRQFAHLENLPTYHQAHYYILNSYTNHLYLILNSYILTGSDSIIPSMQRRSSQRLSDASIAILANYETLRSTPAFQKYRWYTDGLGSFHAFLAASTLAMLYGGAHDTELIKQNKPQVARSLCRCMLNLQSAVNRSEICARAVDVLSRLLSCSQLREPLQSTDTPTETLATPHSDIDQPPTAADMGIDLDGWTTSAEFENTFCHISTQQWLSPSVFPWSKWDGIEYARGQEAAQEIVDLY